MAIARSPNLLMGCVAVDDVRAATLADPALKAAFLTHFHSVRACILFCFPYRDQVILSF